MSGGVSCACLERKLLYEHRLWRVIARNGNASAFNGYHWTYSDYSAILCLRCQAVWRTRAGYVDAVQSISDEEKRLWRLNALAPYVEKHSRIKSA